MKVKGKKRKGYLNKKEMFELRHYIADSLVKGGLTAEKFNKLMGFKKN